MSSEQAGPIAQIRVLAVLTLISETTLLEEAYV